MNLQEKICEALCGGFSVRSVPIGFAIASPFDWFTGDKMIFYARTRGSQIRFEDSGSTVFDLEGAGVDFSSPTRVESLKEICAESRVTFDEDECLFTSEWVDGKQIGLEAVRFMSFMVRVQDMLLTIRARVNNTFRDDLIAAVKERFGNEARVETSEAPVDELSYYVVDIVIRHKSGKIAAIFPATSEEKALESVLFAKELELQHIDNVIPFLVFEKADGGTKIRSNTRSKALNSELKLASWDGGKMDVMEKIAKSVAG